MHSFLTIVAALVAVYLSTCVYGFVRNLINARKTGLPSVWLPFIDQDNIPWVMFSTPLRAWLQEHLPAWIFDRVTLAIYGWEFHQRNKPFEDYCGSQIDAKTFILITPGLLEINTANAEIAAQVLGRPNDFVQQDVSGFIVGRYGSRLMLGHLELICDVR